MDTRKLPLSMLVALGLAPSGCEDIGCVTKPCLNMPDPDPPPADRDGKRPGGEDPDAQPCLNIRRPVRDDVNRPDEDPKPETDVKPCLSKPRSDPPVGPCLKVAIPDDRDGGDDAAAKAKPGAEGGMARNEVLDRLLERRILPADIAARLRPPSDGDV